MEISKKTAKFGAFYSLSVIMGRIRILQPFSRYQKYLDRKRKKEVKTSVFENDSNESEFDENEHEIVHGTYKQLLFSPQWKEKRKEIIIRDAEKCIICGNTTSLEVHHRQYHYLNQSKTFKAPWDYDDHLLITLCNSCHQRGHRKYKVPILTIN